MSGGRPRDIGNEKWATITEVAEALGVTYQAIRNRMTAGTVPYEQHIENERPSYRIPRAWLEKEVKRKQDGVPATVEDAQNRTQDLLTAYEAGIERLVTEMGETKAEISEAKDVIRREVEIQHTSVVPLLEAIAQDLIKQGGENQKIITNQEEFFKLLRQVIARAEEEDRREAEYQNRNLEIQQENQRLQREVLEVHQRLAEQLSRVEAAERERAESGRLERRSFWSRLFTR